MLLSLMASSAVAFMTVPKPPPEYQKPPSEYVLVHYVPAAKVAEACKGSAPPGMAVYACSRGSYVILPNPCEAAQFDSFAELACHEMGHVNGWHHRKTKEFH